MFEAYSIGIRVRLVNLATQGLALLGKDILKTHGQAVQLEKQLNALKLAGAGFAALKIGDGMLGSLGKTLEVSKEYTRQLSLMGASGMSQKDIAEATGAAWKTSKDVLTSSAAENLAAIRELRSVFGTEHMHEAYGILPVVQRTRAVMEALSGKPQEHVAFDMVKAIELRNTGVMSMETMQRNADMMARTLMAFGGTLNVHDYHMALKTAKTSGMRLDDDFVYKYLPTLMQEVKTGSGGAQSAGTILETMRRAIAGGRIPEKMIGNWLDAGLVNANGVGRGGAGNRHIKPGSIVGTELFLSNPFEWANTIARPAIEKLMKTRNVGFDTATAMLFGDRNAEFGISTLIKKAAQFERDRKLVESEGNSMDTYQKLLKTNPQLASDAMHKQWENVQARLGYEVLPRLIPYMIKFADSLDGIGQWMQRNGAATKSIAFGFAGIAVGLSVLGRVLMTAGIIKFLGLGPMIGRAFGVIGIGLLWLGRAVLVVGRALLLNPIGLVITAIAAAAYLLWRNWDEWGPKLTAVWETVRSSLGAVADWIVSKWRWVKSLLPFGDGEKEATSPASPGTPSATAAQPGRYESRYVATRDQGERPLQAKLFLTESGRREIASSTSAIQAREVSRPLGSGMYDPGLGLPPVGMNYAK